MLEVYPPDTLLVVATTEPALMVSGLNAALSQFSLTPLPRGMFDDTEVREVALC